MSTQHPADDCPDCQAQARDAEDRERREAAAEADERLYRSYQQRISNLEYGIDAAIETINDMDEDSDPRTVLDTVRHYLTSYRDLPTHP